MVKATPVCVGCAHFDTQNQEAMRCAAFPNGIPDEFAEGRTVHRKPVEGDNGLRYEPRRTREDSNIAYWKASEYGSGTGRMVANGWEMDER
jgi:hypothetical protein